MLFDLDGSGALYQQVFRAVRADILACRLTSGARLPSTRELAAALKVSRNVVVLAYEQLLAEGYAQARAGSGTMVAATLPEDWRVVAVSRSPANHHARRDATARLAPAGARALEIARRRPVKWELQPSRLPYDFRFGRSAFGEFPNALWCRLLGRRARRASLRDLDYGPPEGQPELREAIAERIRRLRGIDTTPDRIVIVNGSQQALDLISRALIEQGDPVLIEEPHYLGARWAFRAAGAKLVAAPVSENGIRIPATRGPAPRLAYVTPSHQFPTGVVMPLASRLELLEWAARSKAFVVEDDYDSEFRYEGNPLQALAGLDAQRRVIYVGTFSKLMFPALRLGYLVLPESLIAPIVAIKAIADTGTSTLQQLTMADFIREGHLERHLHRSRARNKILRAAMLEAIGLHFGERAEVCGANAGLHVLVWLRGRDGGTIDAVSDKARRAGVGLYSVRPYYLRPPDRTGVLLGYCPLSEREVRDGIKRLASALV
jgi:GntR family transcriptional regulator / MocR family aminotransferase